MMLYVAMLDSLSDLWEQAEISAQQSRDTKKDADQQNRETEPRAAFLEQLGQQSGSYKTTESEVFNCSSFPSVKKDSHSSGFLPNSSVKHVSKEAYSKFLIVLYKGLCSKISYSNMHAYSKKQLHEGSTSVIFQSLSIWSLCK